MTERREFSVGVSWKGVKNAMCLFGMHRWCRLDTSVRPVVRVCHNCGARWEWRQYKDIWNPRASRGRWVKLEKKGGVG